MVWHFFRFWVLFFFRAFYRRITGTNLHHLHRAGPVIISMNHPNAFTDPLVLTCLAYPQRIKFLARGDVFRPGFTSWLFDRLGILPIFRMQDAGKEGLMKNDASYRKVNEHLAGGGKVTVFSEGLCIQERRLRPLKKGVARMVFGAWESLGNSALTIIPVGLNYDKPDRFRSNVYCRVGDPIFVRDYAALYDENPARAYNKLLADLTKAMRETVTHIDNPQNDKVVEVLEEMIVPPHSARHPEIRFLQLDKLTRDVNTASEKGTAFSDFRSSILAYHQDLKTLKISDAAVKKSGKASFAVITVCRWLVALATAPMLLTGVVFNYPAAMLTGAASRRISKEPEFFSSFCIGAGTAIFTVNYLLIFFLADIVTNDAFPAFLWCIACFVCGWLAFPLYRNLTSAIRGTRLLANPSEAASLKARRNALLLEFNKFCAAAPNPGT